MGKVLFTDLENIFEMKEIPEEPPGILSMTAHIKATIWHIAHKIVKGVLCKCKAQKRVPIKVPKYTAENTSLSLEKICFKNAIGPHKKHKLK